MMTSGEEPYETEQRCEALLVDEDVGTMETESLLRLAGRLRNADIAAQLRSSACGRGGGGAGVPAAEGAIFHLEVRFLGVKVPFEHLNETMDSVFSRISTNYGDKRHFEDAFLHLEV